MKTSLLSTRLAVLSLTGLVGISALCADLSSAPASAPDLPQTAPAPPMPVTGDTGWLPKQDLRFGPYVTARATPGTKVQGRAHTEGTRTINVRRAHIDFTLKNGPDARVRAKVETSLRVTRHDALDNLIDLRVNGSRPLLVKVLRGLTGEEASEEVTRATLTPLDGGSPWQMLWRPANPQDPVGQVLGLVSGPQGDLWPVRLQGETVVVGTLPDGKSVEKRTRVFELVRDDQVVATVSGRPQSRVWISPTLNRAQQDMAAAGAAAVLMSWED